MILAPRVKAPLVTCVQRGGRNLQDSETAREKYSWDKFMGQQLACLLFLPLRETDVFKLTILGFPN